MLKRFRHALHRRPEVSGSESETASLVVDFLKRQAGLQPIATGLAGHGLLYKIQGSQHPDSGNARPSVLLRCELDALPLHERTDVPHSSEIDGRHHACGHDGHMAMLLGAAYKLSTNANFGGTIVFIFQPNEELGLGAKAMMEEGLLKNFPIQEIYGIHNLPGVPTGELLTRSGIICSSESLFEIKIKGMGGHSSMPQMGRDTITIGAEIVQALQTIISRRIASGSGAVFSVTEFISNGQRNVLAGETILKGDVRTRQPDDRKKIEIYLNQIASGIASAHDIEIEVSFETEFIETINHIKPTEAVLKTAKKSGLKITNCKPMSFSEDFSHFSNAVPGCFFLLGNGIRGTNNKPLHSSDYDFNDALLPIGADFWTNLAKNRFSTEGSNSV